MPTLAEWKFAARGGNSNSNYKFSGSNDINNVGWYSVNSGDSVHDIMGKQPNELGIYDMGGNVWEWCWDLYRSEQNKKFNSHYNGSLINNFVILSLSYRCFCGGSWDSNPSNCDITFCYDYLPASSNNNLGFRVVRSSSR